MAKELSKEDKKKKLALQKKYGQRITIARQGREAFALRDFVTALSKYKEYLQILAGLNDLSDIFQLAPAHFDNKREVTEMLLISQIFWDIARIHEMTPSLGVTFTKGLNQFVKFTVNQPYQVLNAEMLRKYIKKQKGASPQAENLNQAYQQIFVQSKKCYISTLCYGQNHPITLELRCFKDLLAQTNSGIRFIGFYYKYSSRLVTYLEKATILRLIITFISKPFIITLAKTTRLSIFKACISYLK